MYLHSMVCEKRRFSEIQIVFYETKMFSTYKNSYTNIELSDGHAHDKLKIGQQKILLTKDFFKGLILTLGLCTTFSCGTKLNYNGQTYSLRWQDYKTTQKGIDNLQQLNRIEIVGRTPRYILQYSDFPYQSIDNIGQYKC